MELTTFQNIDNYKSQLSSKSTEILAKYINIVTEYFVNFSETISIKNPEKYNYLLIKGLLTLNHVFIMLLFYTKNLYLAYYHSQKSVYYYIEFINQIDDNNINQVMQLNSNNATLFVYKKTLFEINNEVKREVDNNSQETNIVLKNTNKFIEIYQDIINIVVQSPDLEFEPEKAQAPVPVPAPAVAAATAAVATSHILYGTPSILLQKIYKNMSTITHDLLNLSLGCSEELYNSHLDNVLEFTNHLHRKKLQTLKYIELYIKKINPKNKINTKNMIHLMLREAGKIEELAPSKYINWLFRALTLY